MAFNVGKFTEFDDTNSAADASVMVAAAAIPLSMTKAAFYQSLSAPAVGLSSKTVDYDLFGRSKTVKAGTVDVAWDAVTAAALGIDAVSIKGITVGSVLKMASGEYVIVSAVDRSAVTIDVYARGAGGTTGAIQADASVFSVVGFAGKDSTLKDIESMSESTGKYTNYTQTVFETLDWEYQGANYARKGLAGDKILPILLNEATVRVAENLGVMSILGLKQEGASGGSPYMTAGLFSQLADTAGGTRPVLSLNVGGAFNEIKLRSALQELTATGSPDMIWLSAKNKEIMNGFNSAIIQTGRIDTTAGSYIDTYNYDGLMLAVRVDADIPDDKIAIVKQANCQLAWVENDGLRLEDEPTQSSREFRQSIQGTLGFIIEGVGYDHTYLYGIV